MSTPKPPRKSAVPLIDSLELAGKRVFLRIDLDTAVSNGRIVDDSRIRAAIPTVKHALERGARLIIGAHVGSPKGVDPALSLAPAGEVLAGLLKTEILLADDAVGDGPTKLARELRDGQILMLENLRFHEGEEKNDDAYARQLAALAEIYVDDAFGMVHRTCASNVGITAHLKTRAGGFLVADEVDALTRLLAAPKADYVALLGGSNLIEEVGLIERLLPRVETLLIGGTLGLTFLSAKGHRVGASAIETGHLRAAAEILASAQKRGVEVLLPIDHFAVDRPDGEALYVPEIDIPSGLHGMDIGPRTQAAFRSRLEGARTLFWNGALAVSRSPRFNAGTQAVLRAIAASQAFSVVVGDDAVGAVHQAALMPKISHLSTGGAASLEFLEGRELPGLTALGWKRGH